MTVQQNCLAELLSSNCTAVNNGRSYNEMQLRTLAKDFKCENLAFVVFVQQILKRVRIIISFVCVSEAGFYDKIILR